MEKLIELCVAVLICATGVIGYRAAANITGFSFDPLGPAAVPLGIAGLVTLLSLGIIVQIPLGKSSPGDTRARTVPPRRYLVPLLSLGLVFGFAYGVFVLRAPLSLMTIAFVILCAQLLPMPHRGRGTVVALVSGVILGFGAEWIFTRFFLVDLPTLW